MSYEVLKYSESLMEIIAKVHEACEGRYELTGYDLHVIEAGLEQLQDLNDSVNLMFEMQLAVKELVTEK